MSIAACFSIAATSLRSDDSGEEARAVDIDIQAREILRVREELNNILVQHTGQSMKRIEKDTDRDMFMTGKQALEYGIVDEVIADRPGSKTKV